MQSHRPKRSRIISDSDAENESARKQLQYMVFVGYDKMSFYVRTDDKNRFPNKPGVPTLEERYSMVKNQTVQLYWENENGVNEPIRAKFKSHAATVEIAKSIRNSLSKKIMKPGGTSTISGDTEEILYDLDTTPEFISQNNLVQLGCHDRTSASTPYRKDLQAKSMAAEQLRNRALGSTPVARPFERDRNTTSEVIDSLKQTITANFDELFEKINKMDGNLERLEEKLDDMDKRQTEMMKDFSNSMKPSKPELRPLEVVEKSLVEANDENLEWLVEQINLSKVVNKIYEEKARVPANFVKEIACTIYGDLLARYKFSVKRVYTDRHQRLALCEIDPVGVRLINYVIDKFYEAHKEKLVPKDSATPLTNTEFRKVAHEVIDSFGSQANCKGGRKTVFVTSTLFYEYVVVKKMKPTNDFSDETRTEITEFLDSIKMVKETKKEKKRRDHAAKKIYD